MPFVPDYQKLLPEVNANGDVIMPWGKYQGNTIRWIVENHPEYAVLTVTKQERDWRIVQELKRWMKLLWPVPEPPLAVS